MTPELRLHLPHGIAVTSMLHYSQYKVLPATFIYFYTFSLVILEIYSYPLCCFPSYPDANPCDSMLDQLFHEKNRNRSLPCVQVILY